MAALASLLLASPAPAVDAPAPAIPPVQVEFAPFNDKAFLEARRSGSPVGLYFEADWCGPCLQMHGRSFVAPAVVEAAAGIRFFRVDMSKPDAYVSLVMKSFHVVGAPTVILFGPDGKESGRRFGFIPPGDLEKMFVAAKKPAPAVAAGSS